MTKYILNILLFNTLLFVLYFSYGFPNNIFFGITNYFIIIISLFGIFNKPQEYYSVFKFFYLFSLLFFGLIPYLNSLHRVYYWDGSPINTDYFIVANIIILLSLVSYWILYHSYHPVININKIIKIERYQHNLILHEKNKVLLFFMLLMIISCTLIFHYRDFTFLNLFFRETIYTNSKMELLFASYFLMPIPILILLIFNYISKFVQYKYMTIYKLFFMLSAFLFVFPTSTARFFAVTMYFAVILSMTNILEKKYRIQYGLLFGVFFIFPLLDKFRFIVSFDKIDWSIDFHFLQAGHFDAYQNFVRLISIDYISYGYQLYGPIAFFIPRSVWSEKPIGSGHLLAQLANIDFSNISMPLLAEGYINFGIIGTLLFVSVFAILSKYMDFKYWTLKKYNSTNSFYPIYFLFLGLSLFIMRGDLMSSFAYSITIICVYKLINKIIIFIVSKKVIYNKKLNYERK